MVIMCVVARVELLTEDTRYLFIVHIPYSAIGVSYVVKSFFVVIVMDYIRYD